MGREGKDVRRLNGDVNRNDNDHEGSQGVTASGVLRQLGEMLVSLPVLVRGWQWRGRVEVLCERVEGDDGRGLAR